MEKEANYYGILPAEVRYANISSSAKVLYAEFSALTNKEGYSWASDNYFAELYRVSRKSVSLWVQELKNAGLIQVFTSKDKEGTRRKVFLAPVSKKGYTGVPKKGYTNNTSKNNTRLINTNSEVELLKIVNKTLKREFRVLPRGIGKTLELFSLEEIEKALQNLSSDAWHSEKLAGLKLDYLLRATTIDKFRNVDSIQQKSYEQKFGKKLNLETMQYEEYEL